MKLDYQKKKENGKKEKEKEKRNHFGPGITSLAAVGYGFSSR